MYAPQGGPIVKGLRARVPDDCLNSPRDKKTALSGFSSLSISPFHAAFALFVISGVAGLRPERAWRFGVSPPRKSAALAR
jgi:hypothetical protein